MGASAKSLIAVVVLTLLAALAGLAHAQDGAVTLRTDARFALLSERLARDASRRLGRPVVVGAPLEGTDAETRIVSTVRLTEVDGRAELAITGASGRIYATRLAMAADQAASVRALVLSLASLMETAATDPGPPIEATADPQDPPLLGPTDGSALRDLADPFEHVDYSARPLFELRGRLGLGTQRDTSLGGAGLAAGVCFGPYCLVLDADVLTPEEDHPRRFGVVSYVFTTVGVGGRFLPLRLGPLRGGIGVSLLLRTGHLWIDEQDVHATTFAAGGRFSIEGTLTLADPLALVLSGGADVAFNPTRFVRAGETVFLEDVIVPWLALGLRICPN
jgi:hypothetical protein